MLAGLWQRLMWPVRTAASLWWASHNQRDLAPVPAARSLMELCNGAARITVHYKPDPINGLLDYSEDPRRVQYHLERGTLGKLHGLDCDDLAYWVVAAARDLAGAPGSATNHVLILTDVTGRFSHAVAELWIDGNHIVIDTNGTHAMSGWPSVSALFQTIYPEARYRDELREPYPFPDPARA